MAPLASCFPSLTLNRSRLSSNYCSRSFWFSSKVKLSKLFNTFNSLKAKEIMDILYVGVGNIDEQSDFVHGSADYLRQTH